MSWDILPTGRHSLDLLSGRLTNPLPHLALQHFAGADSPGNHLPISLKTVIGLRCKESPYRVHAQVHGRIVHRLVHYRACRPFCRVT